MFCNNDKTIYIVDGYGFIFRAFYAVPNLKSSTGEPIGAVFGLFKMLISLINSVKPKYLVVALDTGKRTFRNDIYDDFIEKKYIDELYNHKLYKNRFDEKYVTLEEIKNLSSIDLIDKLNIDNNKVVEICNKFELDILNPPKILILLIFLNLDDNINVEDYKTQYKANRKETPEDLKKQFKIVRELIDNMGIATESSIGYEADDVIATISNESVKNGYKVIVVSGDKDLCQLVNDDKILVYDPLKKKMLDEKGVIEKFGVKSFQICDYLSIVGDHCDNVYGVNGIGPKGAVKLLNEYGSIENIMLHLNELDEKTKNKFIESKEILELAHNLISLKYDALTINNFNKYLFHLNENGCKEFRQKYGFKDFEQNLNNIGFNKKNNYQNNKKNEIVENNINQENNEINKNLFSEK